MNLLALAPEWVLWILIALLGLAAVQDAIQLKISNWTSGAVALLAAVAAAAAGPQIGIWQNLAAFVVVLVLGSVLFARGWMGGGDVKLLAAVTLWTDAATALGLIVAILLCGGVLAVLLLVLRAIAPARARRGKALRSGEGIPYGVAIAAGTVAMIMMHR